MMANMTHEPQVNNGPGRTWNAAGWFGCAVGGTAWMLITTIFLLVNREFAVASVPLASCLLVNLVAWGLWRRRTSLPAFTALMYVLTLLAIATPAVHFTVTRWGSPLSLTRMNWPTTWFFDVLVCVFIPIGMLYIWYVERPSRRRIDNAV